MSRHPLDEAARLKRVHSRWLAMQALFGSLPVFALVNRFHPILTDGYGRDLIPTLLPTWLGRHHNLLLALSLACLAASEIFRRRFFARYKDELEL